MVFAIEPIGTDRHRKHIVKWQLAMAAITGHGAPGQALRKVVSDGGQCKTKQLNMLPGRSWKQGVTPQCLHQAARNALRANTIHREMQLPGTPPRSFNAIHFDTFSKVTSGAGQHA